jgi:type VI secretion system secreted protein VgrG
MQATTSCPTLCPGQVLKVTGGEEVAGSLLLMACSSRRCTATPGAMPTAVEFAGIPDSPDVGYRPEPGASGDGRDAAGP